IAESAASLLKVISGRYSDRLGKRKPLALAGYGISTLARPVMALAMTGWHVVALRFFDRIGKGVRTSPRDALISESVTADTRGLAFSFHRMMDHAGAVAGPLTGLLVLRLFIGTSNLWQQGAASLSPPEMTALRWLFACALLPGLAAMLSLWLGVRDIPHPVSAHPTSKPRHAAAPKGLPRQFYIYLLAVILFTLGNSSDLFLIFYAQTTFGLGLGWTVILWIFLHFAKIVFSIPGGRLSDILGRRAVIISGWAVYMGVYIAIPLLSSLHQIWLVLLVYGLYYGLTEGAEKALVADFTPVEKRGTAYGLYHGAVGFAALPASLLFGVFWAVLGPRVAFFTGAALAFLAMIVLLTLGRQAGHQVTMPAITD
ncbi:MFS transporter, partial [bacterium]|nr:MFS transporter [candidate division CSSED10-310 bacterium]